MTVYFQDSIRFYKTNKNGRAKKCPCGHFKTNRTLTNFLIKIDSEAANFQKIIEIERAENERKLNQMNFEEFFDEDRPPIEESDKIDKFLFHVADLARYFDFNDHEFLEFS